MKSVLKNNKRVFAMSGADPSLATRVTTLENNEYKITYFAEISSSTGSITIPTGATILLDQLQGGVDAYVCTIQNGQPTGNFPQTSGGVTVDVTSFDALGAYTLSGTPSSYPVALIYILKIKAKDYSNLDITKILDLEEIGVTHAITNQFRLTLTSGVAVTTGDVVNASTIYCTPYNGNKISLYNGTNWVNYTSNEFSLALGTLLNKRLYDVFCYANAGVPTLEFLVWTNDTTRATALTLQNGVLVKSGDATRRFLGTFYNQGNQSATVTISNASPAVITYTGHGLSANTPVVFSTTGALPSGLVAGTTYYVASTGIITANTFNISATPGGTVINTTTAGSGTHTCTVPTYTEDSQLNRFLSNYDNQVVKRLYRFEATTSWTYTTATFRQANANRANQINFVQCVDNIVFLHSRARVANSTANIQHVPGIGLDTITSQTIGYPMNQPASYINLSNAMFMDYTGIGLHYLAATEFSVATGTCTWYAFFMTGEFLC